MSIRDKINNALFQLADGPHGFAKLMAASALTCGILVGTPVYISTYMDHQNSQALQDRIDSFSDRPTLLFNSVAQCVEKDYSLPDCKASHDEAFGIASSAWARVSYRYPEECVANHGSCGTIFSGGGGVYGGGGHSEYIPLVAAWQAAQDSIKEAVPLYQSATPGKVWRSDGQLFPAP